ncbi:MAG: cache and HAMP domain-containing protein, partial [Spirochaetales bacterium]|nr:cache and HAMP domain-containing protein [Spirochaetales bacterium]
MFKKMKIGTKLVLIGGLLIVLPIVIIAYFAIAEAGDGIKQLEREQLETRTREIAEGIDNVLTVQKNFAQAIAAMPITVEAITAGYVPDQEVLSPEVEALVQNNVALMSRKDLADVYIAFIATDSRGIIVASDNRTTVGLDLSERDYIQGALKGAVSVGSPAIDKVNGILFVGVSAPVTNNDGKIIGVAAVLVRLAFMGEMIAGATIGESGYAFMVDATGTFIAHPNPDIILKDNIGDLVGMEEIYRRTLNNEYGFENYVYQGIPKTAGFAPVESTGWSVCLSLPDVEYLGPVTAVRNIVLLIGIISFAIAMLIFILFSRSITRPLRRAVDFAGEVAAGDLSVDLEIRQKDEIGVLAEALRNMLKALQYKAKIVERIAEGDLTVDIE